MNRLFLSVAFLTVSLSSFAQDVDNFEVGPYDVYYWGEGDYRFRLREGIDLYDYFGLKKDTTIQVTQASDSGAILLKNGFQLGLSMETCISNKSRHSTVYSLSGHWKQSVSNGLYLNGGLSAGMLVSAIGNQKYNLLEVGVPLSVELSKISKGKASLFGGIGVIPTFYSTMSAKYEPEIQGSEPEKYSGLCLAPQIDFGGYVPCGSQIVKVGLFLKYKVNCSGKDFDIYNELIGKTFFGANVGIVF